MGYRSIDMMLTPEERIQRALMASKTDPYAPVTMESQVQQQLAVLDPNNLPSQAPMVQPYDIPSERDILQQQVAAETAGRRSQLDSQRDMAQAMRNRAMPKGQSVGPSGIFVRNPYDSAATAVSRIAGAMMERNLRDDYAELDKADSRKNLAKLKLTDVLTNEQREYESGEAALDRNFEAGESALGRAVQRELGLLSAKTARRGQDMTAQTAAAGQGVTRRGQDMTAATAAATLEGTNMRATNDVIVDFANKPSMQLFERGGTFYEANPDGTMGSPVRFPEGGVIRDTKATGSDVTVDKVAARQAAAAAAENASNITDSMASINRLERLLSDPKMSDYMGYNPEALAGSFGQGPEGGMVQAYQRELSSEELGGLIPTVKDAELTPVSNSDIETLRAKYANARSQPETLFNFYATDFRDQLRKQFDLSIQAGTHTEADKQKWLDKATNAFIAGARAQGFSPYKMMRLGFTRAEIEAYLKSIE